MAGEQASRVMQRARHMVKAGEGAERKAAMRRLQWVRRYRCEAGAALRQGSDYKVDAVHSETTR